MRPIQRLRITITPVLLGVLIVLVWLNLARRDILTLPWFATNKESLGAIGSTIPAVIALIAGWLTYFRFFRGRTFIARAQLGLKVSVHQDPSGPLLHSIRVEVINLNSQVIWSPFILARIDCLHADGTKSQVWVESWWQSADKSGKQHSDDVENIHPGENSSFFAQLTLSPEIWLATYTVTVSLRNGRSWTEYVAIENKVTANT